MLVLKICHTLGLHVQFLYCKQKSARGRRMTEMTSITASWGSF